MRLLPSMFAFILIGTAVSAAADGNSLEATLARMDQVAKTFKGLTADVRRVAHTEVIKMDSVDEGSITVKRLKAHDTRMRIDIRQPDAKIAAIAGNKAEVYYPKINTVQVLDLTRTYRDMVDKFMLLGFGSNSAELRDAYSVKLGGSEPEMVAGEKTTRIELAPKAKELLAQFQKCELWISDAKGIMVQQKLYQTGGDYQLATYTNVKLTSSLPDSAVKLDLPKGVKVEYPAR